ncbi:MAG TPA: PDZ domain-containing protein, partial [Terriglobales bacterium]|nr:PDZ domain-containing protein [Terriglobales bacterium]
MNREFQIRFTAGLLILLTTAAVVLAWINFQKERDFQIPWDGVWWMEQANDGLVADRVEPNGPGDKAGIRVGDRLTAINEREVNDTPTRMRQVYRVGAWSKATYSVIRQSVPVDMTVILVPAERSLNFWLRFIALIYLGIGL